MTTTRVPRRVATRLGLGLLVVAAAVLTGPAPAGAHPLGNVSVNHYAGIRVGVERTTVDYVLDLAELPTVRERQTIDTDGDGALGGAESAAFVAERCAELAAGVELRVGDEATGLDVDGGEAALLPGAAGLSVLRLECRLSAPVGAAEDGTQVELEDTNEGGRTGWREVTAVGDGTTLVESDVATESVSERLSAYPEGVPLLAVRSASLVVDPGGTAAPAASVFGAQVSAATDTFTSLVASDKVTVPFVALALVVATAFGAVHALSPGHGKTIIAAYLIGQSADRRMALILGSTVAVTHTVSVLAFGALLWATEAIAPEEFYPAFGLLSGLLFVALGVVLLRQVRQRRARGGGSLFLPAVAGEMASDRDHRMTAPVLQRVGAEALPHDVPASTHTHEHGAHPHTHDAHGHDHGPRGHSHDDDHPHGHDHGPHSHGDDPVHAHEHGHDHGHDHDHRHAPGEWHDHSHVDLDAVAAGAIGWRQVVLPGLAGGLVPSPSALLVFLGGLALGRAWFGIGLVLGYGVGIALTLVTAGWLLSRAGGALRARAGGWPLARRLVGVLPTVTAVLVILGGLHLSFRAVAGA
jgi:ABC-type nickel/cobalt efflux system permease component RcnA